ncbi:FtsK/SpoIIIE domain-containing protein, partial [Staphylococcus aureus]
MILKNKAENPTHAIFGIATDGTIINAPISKFPHGLIAGATGSGKSVMINTILISVMTIAHPDEVKFLIIDPK